MKLLEEIKHCIDGDCGKCRYGESEIKLICRGLLQTTYEEIKKNEELKEQGRLVELPCKIGDVVWCIEKEERKMCKCIVKSIEVSGFHSFALIEKDIMHGESIGYIRVPLGNFGKTVFLTKSEEALKKMNEREV